MIYKKIEFEDLKPEYTPNNSIRYVNDKVTKILEISSNWDVGDLQHGDIVELIMIMFGPVYNETDPIMPDFQIMLSTVERIENRGSEFGVLVTTDENGVEYYWYRNQVAVRKLSDTELLKGLILGIFKKTEHGYCYSEG